MSDLYHTSQVTSIDVKLVGTDCKSSTLGEIYGTKSAESLILYRFFKIYRTNLFNVIGLH